MRFNEIGLKDLVLDFDSNDLQDITIVQGDTKTRGFKVLVSTNNGEIIKASSQYEMRLYGINSNYPDKSFFTKGVIDGDFYKVYISTDMASKSGKLQLQLALFEGTNALIQSRIKEVDVYNSIANGGNVGKDLVVDFGKLQDALAIAEKQQKKFDESLIRQESIESDLNKTKTEVGQFRNELKDVLTTENARVEAEKKRVSAEQIRVSQESTRQSNENTRQSNETARQQNESTRTSQETQRQAEESTRKSEEQKRISAESSRNSEETKRDNAEKIRIENENKRVTAENTRAENDSTYNKNEEQRQSQESTRQTQEQQRIEAEKLRQSQEDTRVSQESTRQSQESTRQSQEQSRVDAESKRATSETTREESEKTRSTNETERQNAEQTRQSNEKTRVSQESSRVEAEKKRAAAESDREGKFNAWDKTMQGVIPTATSTTAGIMKIDVDGETVAASKKTVEESIDALGTAYSQTLNDVNTMFSETNIKIDEKADKKHTHSISDVTNLETTLNKKLETTDITELSTKIDTNATEISITKKIANANSKSISDISTTLDNKAGKAHTHTVSDVTGLKSELDKKASSSDLANTQKKIDGKSNIGHTHSISDVSDLQTTLNSKASTNHRHSISDVSNLQDTLDKKASTSHKHSISDVSDLQYTLDRKASTSHKHDISDINNLRYTLDSKASASDLSSLQSKVNNLSTDKISNKNGGSLSFWTGTQYQYDNIYYKDDNTIYFITE